ncbi:MAG: protein-L-isoaspartate(D-aspartate) O-methyltransferase [Methylomicrobium sp.]|nr:protein-L-isoaspartate(D-aspartate) O-methyltransferase [Methylomicrobium sp.]
MLDDIESEVRLTRHLIGKNALDERVIDAMREVPRHLFVPEVSRHFAYSNGPVSIGLGQTISQPYIVALMTDLLSVKPDDTVLEIGTGSGYQAAILSRLVKQVYSVEIVGALADKASERLETFHFRNVKVRSGDGYLGWPEYAPYDGIIVTAAAPHIPQPLIDQLKKGARLVIPVGLPYSDQELLVIEKDRNGEINSRRVIGVSFVPFTGKHMEWATGPER